MSRRKILTIGFEICDDEVEPSKFRSDQSLLDWDIILFKPDISDFLKYSETFQGKPCLSDDRSFQLKAQTEHWRREIKSAVDSGKLVVVYLTDLCEVSIATGEKQFSGTGRNQKVTRVVTDYNNYQSIPTQLRPVKTKGKEIKLSPKNSEAISTYWHEFGERSNYKVILGAEVSPCLVTKNGDKPVGAILRSKNSSGALVLLPDIDFYPPEFFDEDEEWSKEAKQFAEKYVSSIVALDKTLRNEGELTPEPEWAKGDQFKLFAEKTATQDLLKVESKLEIIQAEKEAVVEKLRQHGRLRNLLFEKGKPLEFAILDALKVLGFEVEQYADGESEFDAVFASKEGRLIGEVEGKDNKAINVDKLRQLALNIHEDLEREEVEEPAKGVLFGNPYRLQPLSDRSEPFTTKCLSASKTSSVALVFTPDLFAVAKYLSDNRDSRFSTKCRKALLSTSGLVRFPELPSKELGTDESTQKA